MITRAPPAFARGHAVGGREHAERRADGDQQIALVAHPHRLLDHLGHQRLTEADRVALEDSATHEAWRILLARTYPVERFGHRTAVLAIPAAGPPHGAVDLDHPIGIVAGLLVEAVDVLRDEAVQLPTAFELDDRLVPPIGFGRPGRRRQPVLPGRTANVGITEVVAQVGGLLGGRILRPEPVRVHGSPGSPTLWRYPRP